MTLPRQILPAATYLVTRRVERRRLLLTPSAYTNGVMAYCFGRAAALHGVRLHALQVLGNHYHAVLSDPQGRLPEFMAWVDRETAKALNLHHGRAGNLWASDHYSAVRLMDAEAVFGKLVYVLANVVQAGLVMDAAEWPGVTSGPGDWLAAPRVIARPKCHLSERDAAWAEVALQFSVPPQFADIAAEQFASDVQAALSEKIRDIRRERRRRGVGYLGVQRVKDADPLSTPRSPQVRGTLGPTFAAGSAEGQRRARDERRHFLAAYREALEAWRRGLEFLFPYGSYWLPTFAGLPCAAPGTGCVSVDTG